MSNVNIERLRELLARRTNASYPPARGEFDGDASPEALDAWERYLDQPVNPAIRTPERDEQDAFTAAWDAATKAATTPESRSK